MPRNFVFAEPRAQVGPGAEKALGFSLPWCFFYLDTNFPDRHTANSNETESSEKPFR